MPLDPNKPIGEAIEGVVKSEFDEAVKLLSARVSDENTVRELAAMANDAAMLPLRAARGEDITALSASLTAEALNRTVEERTQVLVIAQMAWTRAIGRILEALVAGLV